MGGLPFKHSRLFLAEKINQEMCCVDRLARPLTFQLEKLLVTTVAIHLEAITLPARRV